MNIKPMSNSEPGSRHVTMPVQRQERAAHEQTLEVVVPVYNEQVDVGPCIHRLQAHMANNFANPFVITIADNASTDDTLAVATDLATALPNVRVAHLDRKGRGAALAQVWSRSDADVVVYMDVDLSTDLAALSPLVAPLLSGHSDIAIGSRLMRGSRVTRGTKRELISRSYNVLLRGTLGAHFSDAQCGFKAMTRRAARELLPLVKDTGWFFDTELLVLAERAGLRIYEVPVDWVDDPDSSVNIVETAWHDIRGIARLARAFGRGDVPLDQVRAALTVDELQPPQQVSSGLMRESIRFAAIGVASTVAYLALFVAFNAFVGAQVANFVALSLTAVANTAANRRFTFGVRGRQRMATHHGQGFAVFLLALMITSGSLAIYHQTSVVSPTVEVCVLVVANMAATLLRFLLLKHWVFGKRGRSGFQDAS